MPATEAPRSLMTAEPPPSSPPEPFGFDPSKSRRDRKPVTPSDFHSSRSFVGPGPADNGRSAPADFIGQIIGDRYRVRGVLGEGGMGTVYEGEHLGLGRPVAIKVLSPTQAKKRVAVKRFQQEARAAGAIGHPNICEVYDMGLLANGSPYLVMEKLAGQTLASRIAHEGGLPFPDILDVTLQVLAGLIAAHDKGVVHRDIKPENVFLAQRPGSPPIAKILDFGVSKMIAPMNGDAEPLDLTRTGMVMGTPYYMSPEQARGQRDLDGRVDVYACGVMLYELISGKRPFVAPNYNALLLAIIGTKPTPLRELRPGTPPQLEAIVLRAMTKTRDDRYPSARHMQRDLMALVPKGVPRKPPPLPNSRRPSSILPPPLPSAREPDPADDVELDLPTEKGARSQQGRSVHPSSAPAEREERLSARVFDDLPNETERFASRPPMPEPPSPIPAHRPPDWDDDPTQITAPMHEEIFVPAASEDATVRLPDRTDDELQTEHIRLPPRRKR